MKAAETVTPVSWQAFVVPMADTSERLARAWGTVSHLQAVVTTPALREAFDLNLAKVSEFGTEVGQNLALFEQYRRLAASEEYAGYPEERSRVVDNALRDFRLGGADLPATQKARFAEIDAALSSLSAAFGHHVLDATDAFAYYVEDESALAGLPDDIKQNARAAAERSDRSGWKLTLQMPSYMPAQQYIDDRDLREKLYYAYATRAAEFGPPALDNGPLIESILRLRREQAALLGFANFAEYSLATKMADTPQQVLGFLQDLSTRAKPFAVAERRELEDFCREQLGIDQMQSWDIAYASEKLKEARYAFSDQEVKQYFTEDRVLAGLFSVIEGLYSLKVAQDEAPTWHPDVRFYRITDGEDVLVGQFYLDLYAREGKRGGAWMASCRERRSLSGGVQTPVVYLVCNFGRGVDGQAATFSHDNVITLFHEMGHGLHQMLTEVNELGVSGINGVEWDAVELPSQFMENFCWEWSHVQGMTAHVDTGEPLPRALFDRMLAAKHFQVGMFTVRQIEFSLFDMELHGDIDASREQIMALAARIRREVAVNPPPEYNRYPQYLLAYFCGRLCGRLLQL